MRKHWDKIILSVIVLLAIALRLYHFSDWLYFAMDQARDAMLVHKAYDNGISQLPLLGPRAAGTFLRLGPAFYYFQYFSAKIFHSADPAVLAFPDLLFGILSVPLFYFFLRLYFEKPASLFATAMYALSFLAIEYSRFAWNPNSIPFWLLVCFYGLIRFSREEKTNRKKYAWLATAVIGWAIASQMHFLVFLILPVIIALYLVWTKSYKKLDLKSIGIILLIVLVFYFPMILSEVKTGGDNIKQFVFALKNKPQADYSLKDKFFQNIFNHGNYYTLILTSYMSRFGKVSMMLGLILIVTALIRIFFDLRDEKTDEKKYFIKLVVIWFGVFFLTLIPFAFQIRVRFFFPVIFVPFVMVAFWTEWLLDNWKKKYFAFSAVAIFALLAIGLNCEATFAWYRSFAKETETQPLRGRYLVLQPMHGVTLKNLKAAADYLDERSKTENKKIHLYGDMTFRVPLQYLMETKNPPTDYVLMSRKDSDSDALYFALTADKDGYSEIPENYRIKFDLKDTIVFGQRLQLFEMKLKEEQPEYKKGEKQNNAGKKPRARRKERVYWGEVF